MRRFRIVRNFITWDVWDTDMNELVEACPSRADARSLVKSLSDLDEAVERDQRESGASI